MTAPVTPSGTGTNSAAESVQEPLEGARVAKTSDGKKIVPVDAYKRAKPGGTYKKVEVRGHRRSTPNK
jgi:hypothetical protein